MSKLALNGGKKIRTKKISTLFTDRQGGVWPC